MCWLALLILASDREIGAQSFSFSEQRDLEYATASIESGHSAENDPDSAVATARAPVRQLVPAKPREHNHTSGQHPRKSLFRAPSLSLPIRKRRMHYSRGEAVSVLRLQRWLRRSHSRPPKAVTAGW